MKQEVTDVLIENTSTIRRNTSIENDNISIIDPLIEPLIDTDELNVAVQDDQQCHRFEQRCASILTLNLPKSTAETSRFSQIIHRCTGIFYALIGSCVFTCSGFIIKQLRVDFFDALLVRFILQTLIITTFILYKKTKLIHGSTNLILLQIIRTILACSGLLLFYGSYRYIPLPDVTTCRYTQVVWTAIIAMIIFHERISIPMIFAIIFTLIGVIFVAQPTFLFKNQQILSNQTNTTADFEADKSYRVLGLTLGLSCALSLSISIVLNKKLILSKIPQSLIMFEVSFLSLCVLTLYHIYNRFILLKYAQQTMFTWQFFLAASVSLLQVFSSTITQQAVKLEHPSIISIVQSSDILFAIGLQNFFSQVKSNSFVLIGSFLVTTSIFLVGINKFWQDQRKFAAKNTNETKV